MDQPTNPYADPQITADAAAARARWERLSAEEQTAFLIEIGIITPDLQLHPRYGGPTPPGADAAAK
jgi:hypothetical protein